MKKLLAAVILTNVAGNVLLSMGVKAQALGIIAIGVGLLIVWTLARMTLLSWADLSWVLPVTSAGYVLTALAGRYLLAEQISPARWAGTILIMAGTAVVSRTAPRSS